MIFFEKKSVFCCDKEKSVYLCTRNHEVTTAVDNDCDTKMYFCGNSSVVEHHLAKVGVAGPNPVFRSLF